MTSSQANNYVQNEPMEKFGQLMNSQNEQFEQLRTNIKNTKTNSLDQLHFLNDQFHNKLNKIDQLKEQFSNNRQKLFLKTFINIMDRMSNHLQNAIMACQNIDDQIKQDPKCILLAQKLKYFKTYFLNSQLNIAQSQLQLQNQIQKNKVLKQKKQYLLKKIYKIEQKNQRKQKKDKTFFVNQTIHQLQNQNFVSMTKKYKNCNMQTKPTSNNASRKISLNQSKVSQTQIFNNSNVLKAKSTKVRSLYRQTAKSFHRQTKLSDLYKQDPESRKFINSVQNFSENILNHSSQNKILQKINQMRQNGIQKTKNGRLKTKFKGQRNAHTSEKRMNSKHQVNFQNNGFSFEVTNI